MTRHLSAAAALLGAAALVSGLASAQSPRNTHEYLQLFDRDGDGRVALIEYQDYLSRGFVLMDRDGDGILSAAELPAGTRARKAPTLEGRRRELSAAFDRQDLNNDGFLDARELAAPPQ